MGDAVDKVIDKGKKGSKHHNIVNHFIQNKVKLLCLSAQLEKILDKL